MNISPNLSQVDIYTVLAVVADSKPYQDNTSKNRPPQDTQRSTANGTEVKC